MPLLPLPLIAIAAVAVSSGSAVPSNPLLTDEESCSPNSTDWQGIAARNLVQQHGRVSQRETRVSEISGQGALDHIIPSLKLLKNASALNNRHGVYYGNGPDSMGRLLLSEMEGLVKKKGKLGLNPEEKHTVYEIEDLMDMDILPTIFAAHKESLDELQELYEMIITCQTEVSTELDVVQDMQTWSIKHEESHRECRLIEYVWWKEYKKECTEYEVYKTTIKEPKFPPHAHGPVDEWIDWLKEHDAYYCPLYEIIKD